MTESPMTESTAPDLLYTDTEDGLRSAVRALLADHGGPAAVVARLEYPQPYDEGLWQTLAAGIGAAGLLIPEKLGGQGAGHREAAVVLEELGRAATPAPYLTSAVVATEILLACVPESAEAADLLGRLAGGRGLCVAALPLTLGPGGPLPADATPPAGGTVKAVADAVAADTFLVHSASGLYAVPAEAVTLSPQVPLDLTRPLAAVTPREAAGTRLAGPETARAAVERGLLAGAGLLASEQLGLADWCLTETVAHLRTRHQFNRPVGSFQALKHRVAALWLETASARAAARAAADALATGAPDAPLLVSVAQAYCSGVAVRAAEECVQLHGGIGMTWEHPAHVYLKRAKADASAFGSAAFHRTRVAALTRLPPP
ncbi:acyl-CoA dehydrogenase family protein [Streptomyces sp. NPDC048603]|uniref:acyl-CoA dehydrogenase family protein n=1 Tax=Streptomyces sp. NPDC048603 TaxID=3365577 RepID=UPI0037217857